MRRRATFVYHYVMRLLLPALAMSLLLISCSDAMIDSPSISSVPTHEVNDSPLVFPTLVATNTSVPIPAQIPFPSPAPARTFTPDELAPLSLVEFEYAAQLRIISPEIYDAVSELEWVADGIHDRDADPVQGLINLGVESPTSAWILIHTSWLSDGLSDQEAMTVSAIGYLALDMPETVEYLAALPWVADGITEDESWAITSLDTLSFESADAVREIVAKPWFVDGITEDESLALESLGNISYETGKASSFVSMPFLSVVEPPDSHALISLDILLYEDPSVFEGILSHPEVADGITDREAIILSLLHDVYSDNPGLIESLLAPSGALVEERRIDLPLAGSMQLAIVRTHEGAARSMDLLESAVRFSEDYMGEPFPANFVLLLFADAVTQGVLGHNAGINMIMLPDFDVDDGSLDALDAPMLFAHEVAHYYWGDFGEDWVNEGAAEVMAIIYDESTTGFDWRTSDIAEAYPCSIPDLTAFERLSGEPPLECVYALGAGLFLDLYRAMGSEDFQRGLAALYMLGQERPGIDGPGARRSHVRDAFEFHPEARDRVIPKWYGDR